MKLKLNDKPTTEPITLGEAKDHLRVQNNSDNTYITSLITSSRQEVEEYTGLAIINQTWTGYLDRFPNIDNNHWFDGIIQAPINLNTKASEIEIPKRPLQSITHIKTYSDDDVATIISTNDYQVTTYNAPNPKKGKITLRDGKLWPSFTRNADGVEIKFIAGYGSASDVPEALKQAIKIIVAYRYCNREDSSMPRQVQYLLNSYREVIL